MGRRHVTQTRALVQYVVPGERKIPRKPRLGAVLEKQIGDKPSVVLKLSRRKWRVFSESANHERCREHRRRKDSPLTMDATQLASVKTDHIDALVCRHDRDHY